MLISLGLALLIFCSSGEKEVDIEWFSGNFEEAQQIADNRIIQLEFFTDSWPWCVRLDVDTFLDPAVVNISNQFINMKLNAGIQGEGQILAEKYNVSGVPQIVFVDKDGIEIDRIVGYLPAEAYLKRVQEVLNGENTLSDLQLKYKKNPEDLQIMIKLAEKYENQSSFDAAANIYTEMLGRYSDRSTEDVNRARYMLAIRDLFNGNRSSIDRFLKKYSYSQYVFEAYSEMAKYFSSQYDTVNEINSLKKLSEAYPDDASAQNSYAWRMTELGENLNDALIKAQKGVKLAKDTIQKASIIDTEAEVLWKLGRVDEAIQVIEEAIKLQPEEIYFQKQKEKFRASK